MHKKIISIISIILALLTLVSCSEIPEASPPEKESEYIKAVWISYYELSEMITDNEMSFKKNINKIFKELKSKGFNRVTVHTRAFADAFYKSSYFPSSAYCFGTQGAEMPYDPLEIMITVAHKNNLTIESWINPYRVSTSTDFSQLADSNIALDMKGTDSLIVCDSGIYFNPCSVDVTELIVNGVKEIVSNYDVDSICFDDYFYPTDNKLIDKKQYQKYKHDGGELELFEWRRNNVSKMVSEVYSAIKEINPKVTFGISPASNIENNYNKLYADVEKWASEKGYVDYICPQIYFGFQNENQPFMATTKSWCEMAECDLYVALPLYKQGKEDAFAGEGGKNEFVENSSIIARQVTYLSKLDKVKGFYIFSYSSLNDGEECGNLYSAMQNSSQ